MRAYHFLDARWAKDDLQKRHLKISRLDDLNDPFELMAPELKDKSVRHAHRVFRDILCIDRGVLCFSRGWHNPLLWSHYADKHRGICLGFEIPKIHIELVSYSSKRLVDVVQRLLGNHPEPGKLLSRLLATKFRDWKYEDEVRVFVSYEGIAPFNGSYFIDFDDRLVLRQVILGARYVGSGEDVKALAVACGSNVSVIKARLAFKTFTVVRDRRTMIDRAAKREQ